MDDVRESFSTFKKGIKHQRTGSKRKANKPETSGPVEGSDTLGLVPLLETGVVTEGGHGREGGRTSANNEGVE